MTIGCHCLAEASESARNLAVVYEFIPIGIFIQGVSKKLYKYYDWENQETPNGIAVLTENCKFVMALEDALDDTVAWGSYTGLIDNCSNASSIADLYYTGKSDTEAIIEHFDGLLPAAKRAKSYKFPNGQNGYLGSNGEWRAVMDNYETVMSLLTLLEVYGYFASRYWTSTQIGDTDCILTSFDIIDFESHSFRIDNRVNNEEWVRAFTSL